MAKRWYVHVDGRLFDVIGVLMGHNIAADAAAEYRGHHPRLKPDSIRVTDKEPEPARPGGPMPYTVHVTVAPTPSNLLKAPFTSRVGSFLSIERAKLAILEDKDSMGKTFGGLIAPTPTIGREYKIWLATWTEVTND